MYTSSGHGPNHVGIAVYQGYRFEWFENVCRVDPLPASEPEQPALGIQQPF